MPETTATLLIGPADPWFAGRTFRAAHLLVLDEGDRACWRIIPLDPVDARAELASTPQHRAEQWTIGLPEAPQHMLAHGLLAFLATATPEVLAVHPDVARLVRRDPRRPAFHTRVPNEQAAQRVYEVMPDNAQVVVTTLHGSTLHPLDAAGLVRADKPLADMSEGPSGKPGRPLSQGACPRLAGQGRGRHRARQEPGNRWLVRSSCSSGSR